MRRSTPTVSRLAGKDTPPLPNFCTVAAICHIDWFMMVAIATIDLAATSSTPQTPCPRYPVAFPGNLSVFFCVTRQLTPTLSRLSGQTASTYSTLRSRSLTLPPSTPLAKLRHNSRVYSPERLATNRELAVALRTRWPQCYPEFLFIGFAVHLSCHCDAGGFDRVSLMPRRCAVQRIAFPRCELSADTLRHYRDSRVRSSLYEHVECSLPRYRQARVKMVILAIPELHHPKTHVDPFPLIRHSGFALQKAPVRLSPAFRRKRHFSQRPSDVKSDTPAAPGCRRGRHTPPATPQLLVATRYYEIGTLTPTNAPAGALGKGDCSSDIGVYDNRIRSKNDFEISSVITAGWAAILKGPAVSPP